MKHFFVVANYEKDKDFLISKRIQQYLENRGCVCQVSMNSNMAKQKEYQYTCPDKVSDHTECIIVLGGDGTLLQAARDLAQKRIPFIGVNYGKLGYLAEIDKEHIEETLEKLINDEYTIESRMMLEASIVRNGKEIAFDVALNDIVINRSGMLQVMNYRVFVNQKPLSQYTADGMIISTPTGSTAYNLSAGGPIVEPGASLIVMTPICPHTLNTRSIILSDEDEITIEILQGRGLEADKMVTFDGDKFVTLQVHDQVHIRKSKKKTDTIKITNMSFLEVLQSKMGN